MPETKYPKVVFQTITKTSLDEPFRVFRIVGKYNGNKVDYVLESYFEKDSMGNDTWRPYPVRGSLDADILEVLVYQLGRELDK